ncbi:MAG TPA: PorV/PorQ family protein [Clostridiales bacterium]|jgi:hypothetical protein|nr:PorV/PorQ family protein [Clostridiales bacterium]HQP68890.1 PorV/PorQ family protein [Clostridiales bacterium]
MRIIQNTKYAAAITFLLIMLSQSYGRPSEAGVAFLTISPGARPTGMGDSFVGIADDATASWWNPAGLARQTGKELSFMHANWLPGFNLNDMYYDFLAYKQEIEGLGTVGGHITYLYLGEQERMSESGVSEGKFKTYEMAAALSYGTDLSDNLFVGLSTKFIYSHLSDSGAGNEKGSGTGHSMALDLGMLYQTDYDLDIGVSVTNLGPKISYIDYEQADPLPTTLRAGVAYYLFYDDINSLVLTSDFTKLLVRKGKDLDEGEDGIDTSDEWNYTDPIWKAIFTSWTDDDGIDDVVYGLGAEYWYNKMISLRMGFWNDDMGDISATTYGTSLRYDKYIFDFSYLDAGKGHPLTDTMRFSLNVGF